MGLHKCNMDCAEIFLKSAQEQIIIKRQKHPCNLQIGLVWNPLSMWSRTKILTSVLPTVSFLSVPAYQGSSMLQRENAGGKPQTKCDKTRLWGLWGEHWGLQTAQMFKDIFHCLASQSLCLPVFAAWCGPVPAFLTPSCSRLSSAAPCGILLAFTQTQHLRHFNPVEHTLLGLTWLCMFCSPGWQPHWTCALAASIPAGKGFSGLSSISAGHGPSPCCHGSEVAISGTLALFSDGGIGKHLCTGDSMVQHQCRVFVLVAWGLFVP